MHLSCTDTNTIYKERIEVPRDPHHLVVPSGASKIISMPMVHSTQTVHLSCVKISTISKRTKLSLGPHHLAVQSGASKIISEPMVRLAQTMHLSCTDTNTVYKHKEVRFYMATSPKSSIGCVQNDFWAIGMSGTNCAPILHRRNTVSKWKEARFHMTHVT
jgi:hypothetical protein